MVSSAGAVLDRPPRALCWVLVFGIELGRHTIRGTYAGTPADGGEDSFRGPLLHWRTDGKALAQLNHGLHLVFIFGRMTR